ncbi:MAG: CBS domain-containing protein [Caldilineaceae bacterium]
MNSVKQILQSKGDDVWYVAPSGAVLDAVKLMAEKGIGALLVMDGGEVVGIISERDVARKVVVNGGSPADTRVEEIMTKRVYTASLDETAEECLAVMTEMRIRHLPVVEGRRVVGVVSIGDLVKAVISHQRFMIEQLTNYIGQ